MDPVAKDVLGVVILLSMWTGIAGELSILVEKVSSPGSPCELQMVCSVPNFNPRFDWYQGSTSVSDDSRHKVTFGGKTLTVVPDQDNTLYKCSTQMPQKEELSIDVAPTCGFMGGIVVKAGYSGGCSLGLVAVKIIFLCLWLSALGCTVYFCYRQTSQENARKKDPTAKVTEEGIYSLVGTSDTGTVDSPQEKRDKPGPSSAEEASDPTYQGLKDEGKNSEYSVMTPEAASAQTQDPTYQSLAKDKDEAYSTLQMQGAGGEPTVKFSARKEESLVEISLQGENKTEV